MKFTVSYSRKVKAGRTYEMMEIFASVESDTAIEPMQATLDNVKEFVERNIQERQAELLELSMKRPDAEKEAERQ